MSKTDLNKLISVWRGTKTPPTDNHIWVKDGTIWYHNDEKWVPLDADDKRYNELYLLILDLDDSLDSYYTKEEADSKFLTEETDPTVPSWAKQETKPTYTAEEVGALPDTTKIPSKTSDLDNDSNFVTKDLLPKKTSELENDSNYITLLDIPKDLSKFNNDVGYITNADVPTKTSLLENDSNYITALDVPSKTSLLENDSNYITLEDVPTKTSQLQNDNGFITIDDVPTQLSKYINDVGFTTKTEVEELIGGINSYTKEEVDEKFATKIEVDVIKVDLEDKISLFDSKLADKADLTSPNFSGVPTVPTPGEDAPDNQIVNVGWVLEYVEESVNKAVNVVTDYEDGVAIINIAGKEVKITGGDGIDVKRGTEDDLFVIDNTSVLEDHAVKDTTYGTGTETLYGHVKLQTEFLRESGTIVAPDNIAGVAASPTLVYEALQTALAATALELEFSKFEVNVEGVPTISYDPGAESNTSINFIGKNGVSVSTDGSDVIISAGDLLTVDNIHAGINVDITPYDVEEGGIYISTSQREVYAYEIDESGNASEEQKKVLSGKDLEDLKFGPSLMSQSKTIDLAWSEILRNKLNHTI